MDDWQVKCRTMYERLANMLETGFWSDCTFQVGSSKHQLIRAHKNILAAASPVLDTMLYGPLAETNQVIVIKDLEPATFNSLLWYVYTDKVDIKNVEEACHLYYAANKYILPGLQEVCIEYIIKGLSPSNVCQVYEFAKFYEMPDLKVLKEKCLKMIGEDAETVLRDEAFLSAELQTVVDIYSLPQLNISSEMVLLKEIGKYAAHTQLTGPSIRHALHQIRFLSLTPQEFADNCHASTLLSKEEKCDLLMNIVSPHLGVAVPEGFSTNREPRSRNTKAEVQDPEMVSLKAKHCYIRCEGEQHKLDVVGDICGWWYRCVIFSSDVERMREIVKGKGYTALVIHQDMPTSQIDTTTQQYYEGGHYLIAPPSLATSINMEIVRLCINCEVPPVSGYRHTVAGRYDSKGSPPLTITLVSSNELEVVREIQQSYCIHLGEIQTNGNIRQAVWNYRN